VAIRRGRVGWRISIPAMMSYWSELARPITLPPSTIPTTLVRASRTSPPYVTEQLLAALDVERDFTLTDFDCDHMVSQALPVETAAVIRKAIGSARLDPALLTAIQNAATAAAAGLMATNSVAAIRKKSVTRASLPG